MVTRGWWGVQLGEGLGAVSTVLPAVGTPCLLACPGGLSVPRPRPVAWVPELSQNRADKQVGLRSTLGETAGIFEAKVGENHEENDMHIFPKAWHTGFPRESLRFEDGGGEPSLR